MPRYYRPIPALDPAQISGGNRLAGGWAMVREVEVLARDGDPEVLPIEAVPPEVKERLLTPRAPFLEVALNRPRLMGILNATPDSFSDGGQWADPSKAGAHAAEMAGAGADMLDLGGESTRPGAAEVLVEEETRRILSVLHTLKASGSDLPISLDTRKASVAETGLAAGAQAINDVSGLRFDPRIADVAAGAQAGLILMHSIGTPETMQSEAEDAYGNVVLDIYDGLDAAIAKAEAAGVPRTRIVVDPGIGFGKTPGQNRAILARLSLFHGLGCAVLLGVSRKGFVGHATGVTNPADRDPGSAAIGLWAVSQGVQILRVHDISTHRQALSAWEAVAYPGPIEAPNDPKRGKSKGEQP